MSETLTGICVGTKSQREFDAALNSTGGLPTVGKNAQNAGVSVIDKAITIFVGSDGSINKKR